MKLSQEDLKGRISAALGKNPCDLIVRNVEYLDVFSLSWRRGDVCIWNDTIVALEEGLKGKREINGQGKYLVPGYIDAHVHVESSLLTPGHFSETVLPKGTTTAICDPHELANVLGVEGISYFLKAAEKLSIDLRVMLSSCVPATHLETNGGGALKSSDLLPLLSHPQTLGLAEMMNVPGVLFESPEVIEKLSDFSHVLRDGHCPLVTGQALSAYASAGISSCHESTRLSEAQEKLTKGIAVWIREGSVAKDLSALIPLLNEASSPFVGFCTDDRNPLDIAQEGHLDYLLKQAIKSGIASEVAYRSASWSVANHYRLADRGAIAPGYLADLCLLSDKANATPVEVIRRGKLANECSQYTTEKTTYQNTIRAQVPELNDLNAEEGRVHIIEVYPGKIITGRRVASHNDRGVAKLSVLERYGRKSKPANAYVWGFGDQFKGAIASSVGHDSHNLIVVGSDTKEMRAALAFLIQSGGGFCVVQNGAVLADLKLPFGGIMTHAPVPSVEKSLLALRQASQQIGCQLPEPFLQLAFLSLPVIPTLKLTDKGLVDVEQFKIISVRAA